MSKVAIVTDSNSGITQKRGEELGIYVLPMPFFIDGELYLEDITLSQEQFYEKLGADSEISTSQPSPGDVMDLWDKLLEDYDEIVCIPMSSGLSSTCETALSLAQDYDEKVQIIREFPLPRNSQFTMRSSCVMRENLPQRSDRCWKKKKCRQVSISQ